MKAWLGRLWKEEDGVLSFEWVLMVSLLTLGIVAGLCAARDGVIDELGDAAQAMLALDDSYRIDFPLQISIDGNDFVGGTASQFTDAQVFTDCGRATGPTSSDTAAEFGDSDS
jgi:Flp pilus assembly pilin Flp